MGDLGWGEIRGVVTDVVTGKPIQGVLIMCTHNSYTSTVNMLCAGGVYTDANGVFLYQSIFFHDTDTIKLTVTADGYQSQEYTQNFFTTNNVVANLALAPAK